MYGYFSRGFWNTVSKGTIAVERKGELRIKSYEIGVNELSLDVLHVRKAQWERSSVFLSLLIFYNQDRTGLY